MRSHRLADIAIRALRIAAISLAAMLLAAVLLAVIALDLAQRPGGERIAARTGVALLDRWLPGLEIGRVGGDYLSRLVLYDVVLRDALGHPAVTIERIAARYDLLALLDRRVAIEQLEVTRPRLSISRTAGGQLNLATLYRANRRSDGKQPTTWRVDLGAIEVQRGKARLALSEQPRLRSVAFALRGSASYADGAVLLLNPVRLRLTLADLRELTASVRTTARRSGGRLNAALSLRASGLELEGPVALRATIDGNMEQLEVSGSAQLPGGGRLQLDGRAALAGGLGSYTARALLWDVDPWAVWPELPQGRLEAGLHLSGEGTPLQRDSSLSLLARVAGGKLAGVPIQRVALRGDLRGDRWRVHQLQARAGGVLLRARGAGDFEGGRIALRASGRSLRRVQLLAYADELSALGGSFALRADIRGRFRGPLSLRVSGRAEDLRLGSALRVGRGRIEAKLAGLPRRPRGRLSLDASGVVTPKVRFRRAHLRARGDPRALDVRARARGDPLSGELAARLAIAGSRVDLALRRLRLEARGHRLRLARPAQLTLRGRRRLEVAHLGLRTLGGSVWLDGSVRLAPRLRGRARAAFRDLRLPDELFSALGARGGARATGSAAHDTRREQTLDRRGRPPPASGSVMLALDRHRLHGSARVGLRDRGTLESKFDLPVRWPRSAVVPALRRTRPGSIELQLKRLDMALVTPWLPAGARIERGRLSLTARLAGSVAAPRGRLELRLQRAAGLGVEDVDALVAARLADDRMTLSVLSEIAETPALMAHAELAAGASELVEAAASRPELLGELPFDITAELAPRAIRDLPVVHPLQDRLGGKPQLVLHTNGTLDSGETVLLVRWREARADRRALGDLRLHLQLETGHRSTEARLRLSQAGQPALEARARLATPLSRLIAAGRPLHRPLRLVASLGPYDLRRLGRVDPELDSARGRLRGTVVVGGSMARPRGRATIALDRVSLDGAELGTVAVNLGYRHDTLRGTLRLDQERGGRLLGRAEVQLGRGSPVVALVADGRRIDLSLLQLLVPAIQQSGGRIDLGVRLAGTRDAPDLRGEAVVRDGTLRVRGLPLITKINGKIALSDNRVQLERLRGWSKGWLSASGRLQLDRALKPESFALAAKAEDFEVSLGRVEHATFDGSIETHGKWTDGLLKARARIESGTLHLPAKLGKERDLHPTGPPPDVVFTDAAARRARRGRERAPAPAVQLALRARPLFVRSKQLRLDVNAALKLRTDGPKGPTLHGDIRIPHGWVKILKRRYQVRRARLSFSGRRPPDPTLDILLVREFPQVRVTIALSGTSSAPELELRSEPGTYSQSQLVSLILTGRPAAPASGQGDSSNAVISAVSQAVLGWVAGKIAPGIGLDVATISVEKEDQATPIGETTSFRAQTELGKYITDRVYIAYRRNFGATAGENANEGVLEYYISSRWELMATFGDAGTGGLDMFWTYHY